MDEELKGTLQEILKHISNLASLVSSLGAKVDAINAREIRLEEKVDKLNTKLLN